MLLRSGQGKRLVSATSLSWIFLSLQVQGSMVQPTLVSKTIRLPSTTGLAR